MKKRTKNTVFCMMALILSVSLMFNGCYNTSNSNSLPSIKTISTVESTVQPTYSLTAIPHKDFPKWVLGEESQDSTKQGSNNWYYMYTEETNTNGLYDTSKIKECWYSELNKGGSCISSSKGLGKPTWVAGIYSEDTDIWDTGNWWCQYISEPYTLELSPAVTKGPYASAVLAFKAPSDGSYQFDFSFTAGKKETNISGDGVTISVYGDINKLYSRSITTGRIDGETLTVHMMLKSGQYGYLIVDPNENGTNDICTNVRVEVTQTLSEYVNNTESWAFGQSYCNGNGTKQGDNNWYYMYTEETDTNGVYDVSKIAESWYAQIGDTNPYTHEAHGTWMAEVYDRDTAVNCRPNFWYQSANGHFCPEVEKEPYASAVLAWKAPVSGIYSMDVKLFAGSKNPGADRDGVTISIYGGEKKIYSERLENLSWFGYHMEVKLEKDSFYYLIIDPNKNGLSDFAQELDVLIKKVSC